MDPKSFAHLDPKLKETYARVMGTTTGTGDASQNATVPQAPTDPNVTTFDPTPAAPITSVDEPTLSSSPDTSLSSQTQDTSTPPNSSFFSNPSPATTDTPQMPAMDGLSSTPVDQQAAQTPITPYTPAAGLETQNAPAGEPFSQPLPSPASVNHEDPHEVSSLLKVLYIVGAVLFFAIYTIFWIKVFNLPFLF
jgi:hypothetical protein